MGERNEHTMQIYLHEILKKKQNEFMMGIKKILHPNVHSSATYNNQVLGTA